MTAPPSSESGLGPVDRILLDWLGTPSGDQSAFLDSACRDHPELAGEIRRRAAHIEDTGFLEGDGEPSSPGTPDRLGPFRLLEPIGGGGMGVIYLAEQEGMHRKVAVKLLRAEHRFFPRSRERFRREAAAVARLQHAGIVPVFHFGEEAGIPYLAMEHVQGCTVAEAMRGLPHKLPEGLAGADLLAVLARRGEPQPALRRLCEGSWIAVCLRIATAMAEALQHAHERGVIHRDVKPSNIMLSLDGRVMLMDFGLASTEGASKLTRSGAQPGSLPYMAPEQIKGEPVDARSDVYGLGVTLYEMLALACPYWEENSEELRRRILDAQPIALRHRNRAVGRDLETVCGKAMDPRPCRRYHSALEMAADLRAVMERRPVKARPAGPVVRLRRLCQRHPSTSVLVLAILILAIGVPVLVNLGLRAERDEALEQAYGAHIVAADYYLSMHGALGARQQLGECLPAMRGFEWRHLHLKADQSLRRFPDITGYFASMHFAAGGDLILHVPENSARLRALRVADGSTAWEIETAAAAHWADVSPDGQTIALATDAGVLRFDTATGEPLPPLTVPDLAPRWLQYLSAGGGLAVGSGQGEVVVLDRDGSPRLQARGLPPICRAVSPDGRRIVCTRDSDDGRGVLWDLVEERPVSEFALGRFIWSAAFRDDGQAFAIGGEDGRIRVFDAAGEMQTSLLGHARRNVNAVRFTGDGLLYSAGNDGTIQCWDPERGVLLSTMYGHDSIVLDLDLHPQGHLLASVSPFDGTRIWSRGQPPHRTVLPGRGSGAQSLLWSDDGRLLYVLYQDGRIATWEADSGREIVSREAGSRLAAGALSGGRVLATASVDDERAIRLWDLSTAAEFRALTAAGYTDMPLAATADGALLACGQADGRVLVYRLLENDGRQVHSAHSDAVRSVAFDRTGNRLYSGSVGGELAVHDVATGEVLARARGHGRVLALLPTADGELWCGEGRDVVVRDAGDLAELQVLSGHQGWVHDLSLSHDGGRVASASHDGSVRLWSKKRRQGLLSLTGNGHYVYSVAFSPDGRRLAGACGDGTVFIWESQRRRRDG